MRRTKWSRVNKSQGKTQITIKTDMLLAEKKSYVTLVYLILIVVFGFLVYSNALRNPFIWDDDYLIKRNLCIKELRYLPRFFTEDIGSTLGIRYNEYRPLQMVSYTLDHALWGLNTFGYHLTSQLLHILVALVIYWLVMILFDNKLISFLTAILFVVHPVHTEVVTYISGRSDSLSCLFIILGIIFYVQQLKGRYYLLWSCVFIVLSLLSKENSIAFLFLILLYHWIFKKKIEAVKILPYIFIFLAYFLLRMNILKASSPGVENMAGFMSRLPGFFVATGEYLSILLFPFNLHMEYGSTIFKISDPRAIMGLGIMLLLALFSIRYREKNKITAFSVMWFVVSLLPVSNLFLLNAFMAEHWLYLPSIGFFIVIASGFFRLLNRGKLLKYLAGTSFFFLLFFYSYCTLKQNTYWGNPVIFYERTLKYAPESPRIYTNLGNAYYCVGYYDKALLNLKKAIQIDRNYTYAYLNLANAYNKLGDKKEAIALYKKTIELDPFFSEAYYNLGNLYKSTGDKEGAINSYKKALEIDKNFVEAYYNLAVVYGKVNYEEAVINLKKAIDISPAFVPAYDFLIDLYKISGKEGEAAHLYKEAVAHNLNYFPAYYYVANLYYDMGMEKKAIVLYKKAITINPEAVEVYVNMGGAYCVVGNYRAAIAIFKQALKNNPDLAIVHNNIALAYYYIKNYNLAIKHCDRALKLGYDVSSKFMELLKPYRR